MIHKGKFVNCLVSILFIIFLMISCKVKMQERAVGDATSSAIEELKEYLNKQAKKDKLNGTVLIGKGDKILLDEAYGYIDLESSQNHTSESRIGMASMGKMFTAISIMQLKSNGKIDLEDFAREYLDDIENMVIRDSVKIKHLLSHTSGLNSYWDELGDDHIGNDLDYVYSLVKDDIPIAKVGKKFNYSNSGYIFLGKIIEEISGMSYQTYVQKNILNKLNMNNTKVGISDGGGVTTTSDMWKFGQALLKRELLNSEDFENMIRKQSEEEYGYGFKLASFNGVKIYGHTGGFWQKGEKIGVASALDIINDEYTVVVLTNRNPSLGGKAVREHILNRLSRK